MFLGYICYISKHYWEGHCKYSGDRDNSKVPPRNERHYKRTTKGKPYQSMNKQFKHSIRLQSTYIETRLAWRRHLVKHLIVTGQVGGGLWFKNGQACNQTSDIQKAKTYTDLHSWLILPTNWPITKYGPQIPPQQERFQRCPTLCSWFGHGFKLIWSCIRLLLS